MKNTYLIVILASLVAAPAAAETPIEEKNILNGKQSIDPTLGYIYLESTGRLAGTFVRIPDDEDIADYRKDRAEKFEKAQKTFKRDLETWNYYNDHRNEFGRSPGDKPVEPDEENFVSDPIEKTTSISFGPEFVYSKDKEKGLYSYLNEVKPGTYIWYGPVSFDAYQGYVGLCYCMGSVSFDVKPGVITNLGNSLESLPRFAEQVSAPLVDIRYNSSGFNGYKIELPETSAPLHYELPASLSGMNSRTPQFAASGKMNNVFGVMVSRLPRIPGVLEYRRDTVIDASTGAELSAVRLPDEATAH